MHKSRARFLHSDHGWSNYTASTDTQGFGAFEVSSVGSKKDGFNEDFEGLQSSSNMKLALIVQLNLCDRLILVEFSVQSDTNQPCNH